MQIYIFCIGCLPEKHIVTLISISMTQIVVTLENNADEVLLRRMIENMKGVLKTSLTHYIEDKGEEHSQRLDSLHKIKESIDPSVIDSSDPRTNYIMSK